MLWESNQEVWDHYREFINNQFVYDFHALPLVFEILSPRKTYEEALAYLKKLILIHSIVAKPKKEE